jgi:hypothetical protein
VLVVTTYWNAAKATAAHARAGRAKRGCDDVFLVFLTNHDAAMFVFVQMSTTILDRIIF